MCLDCWTNASLLTTLRRLLVSDVHAGFGKAGCLAYWRLELNGVVLGSAVPTGPASLASYLLPASSSASPCAPPRLRLFLRGLVGGQQPSSDDAMDTRRDRDTDAPSNASEALQSKGDSDDGDDDDDDDFEEPVVRRRTVVGVQLTSCVGASQR